MTAWAHRLENYLFAPAAPTLLGRCRVAFYLWVSVFYWPVAVTWGSQNIADFADIGSIFWHPLPLFRLSHLPLLPHPWLDILYVGWKVALACSCVGLFTRLSMWLSFVPALYLLGLPLNFGTVNHAASGLVMALGIMAFSRAGDAVSIDAWWRRRTHRSPPVPSGEYRWPIRFVWILLATIYACAGVGKWASSGLGYLDPQVMASFLRQRALASYQAPLTDWGVGAGASSVAAVGNGWVGPRRGNRILDHAVVSVGPDRSGTGHVSDAHRYSHDARTAVLPAHGPVRVLGALGTRTPGHRVTPGGCPAPRTQPMSILRRFSPAPRSDRPPLVDVPDRSDCPLCS